MLNRFVAMMGVLGALGLVVLGTTSSPVQAETSTKQDEDSQAVVIVTYEDESGEKTATPRQVIDFGTDAEIVFDAGDGHHSVTVHAERKGHEHAKLLVDYTHEGKRLLEHASKRVDLPGKARFKGEGYVLELDMHEHRRIQLGGDEDPL